MDERFGFSDFKDHDFYHARYGRGAVVVAIKKNPHVKPNKNPDLHVARVFTHRDQELFGALQQLDPVESIEEKNGIVKIALKFERRSKNKPSYKPMIAVIERRLPAGQVTFEIIQQNESV